MLERQPRLSVCYLVSVDQIHSDEVAMRLIAQRVAVDLVSVDQIHSDEVATNARHF